MTEQNQAEKPPLSEPNFEFVFEIRATCTREVHIGRGPDEVLSLTPIVGGAVAGPRLNGTVLPGGGDWAVERSGTAQLEARYVIAADDGAAIEVLNRGYFRATPDVIARMESGEHVSEDDPDMYFRTAPVFQTDAPAHRWLAENQFVGKARDEDGQVCIRVFRVL
ncbi:DUF3237 domain-containing protein [Arthrobacter sp. ISL-95]|uniref:DUF3237 domain-containing protein n=1 Tax=Arthrobacter sp. ISL-95 TaxID=2819116 RepID=UPI001BEC318E|nr:DUF3237 domain-containing protein [Arthrobacter sp. ISL-95]MBT2588513.1 DUF3237 domain-containing protein [Arthrobacter sp. ISL-95]